MARRTAGKRSAAKRATAGSRARAAPPKPRKAAVTLPTLIAPAASTTARATDDIRPETIIAQAMTPSSTPRWRYWRAEKALDSPGPATGSEVEMALPA
jgi:hypothetical protein